MNCTQTDNAAAHNDDVANDYDDDDDDDDDDDEQLLSNLPASSMSAISWASASGSNSPEPRAGAIIHGNCYGYCYGKSFFMRQQQHCTVVRRQWAIVQCNCD